LEVVKAVADAIGADRVGIRLSPFGGFLNATDSHPYALMSYLLEELNKLGITYVHMVSGESVSLGVSTFFEIFN
jgi:2,4-dienoyl-CoA reductase-like NADH-dependent reductase (Old Yellow Enzyme family)